VREPLAFSVLALIFCSAQFAIGAWVG
jgi:hypothetical protein